VTIADGVADVLLSTSGGVRDRRPAEHPRFFDGSLNRPEQSATSMLLTARVARTRFYMPPNMVAATIKAADPVVTSNGDRLRFESFSACCGVYARFDVLPEGLATPPISTGTTNVDFNPPMREALARIGVGEPLHLQVGRDVTVTTLDTSVVERKVPLPERWLRGFAEVQLASASMSPVAEINGVEARRFLRTLPASARGPLWVVSSGRTLRLTSRPSPGAVCLAGPVRLRSLEPLVRFTTSLRVYGPPADSTSSALPSAWQLSLDGARITLVLSPEVSRGFSGEGGVLTDLSADEASDDADLVSALLAWEPRIDIDQLSRETALPPPRIVPALTHLGVAGRVGYDLAEAGYFHRELPYDPSTLETMHPRLRDARALIEAGAVQLTEQGALVRSGDIEHRVTITPDETRCTCPWWGKHRGTRGPCKHVLAATMTARR